MLTQQLLEFQQPKLKEYNRILNTKHAIDADVARAVALFDCIDG